MSKSFVVYLLPIVPIVAFAVAGCGRTSADTDETDPLPRVFQNKDVLDLEIPGMKGFGPGSGTGTGGGAGGGMGGGMGKHRPHPTAPEDQPSRGAESAPANGKKDGETEKKTDNE
ncbi:MAG: hypothetical protein HY000_25185 [Planctomycetes bacterium]|nr:hypothetical protein [Planctomycetota bacterium]